MQRILVGVDFGAGAANAVGRARRIADARDAALWLVHVVPERIEDMEKAVELEDRLKELVEGAQTDVSARVRSGTPSEAILEEAARLGAGLIVLGDHGRPRFRDALLGTTASHVAQGAPAPVLVAQNDCARPYRKVMAAVDDETMERVVEAALGVGEVERLSVVHAHVPSLRSVIAHGEEAMAELRAAHEREIRAAVERLRDGAAGPEVEVVVEDADVLDTIVKAWTRIEPDLVVIGTHGRSAFSRLLQASVADTVLLGCPSDILVVPPPA